jgi:translin
VNNLDVVAEKVLAAFETKNAVREATLAKSRALVRQSSLVIRAVHREDRDEAQHLLAEAAQIAADLRQSVRDHPDIYFTGYAQDAMKEFAEASIVSALVWATTEGSPLPDPDELGIEYPAYLNGLGEAVGELRRYVLDLIRRDQVERGERLLQAMDEIYGVLVTIDYPDAITGGLRRTTDMVRGVVERTRGDLTTAFQHQKLQAALRDFEQRLGVEAVDSPAAVRATLRGRPESGMTSRPSPDESEG